MELQSINHISLLAVPEGRHFLLVLGTNAVQAFRAWQLYRAHPGAGGQRSWVSKSIKMLLTLPIYNWPEQNAWVHVDAIQFIHIRKVGRANSSMRGEQQTSCSNMPLLGTCFRAQNTYVQFGVEFLCAFQVEHLPVLTNHVPVSAAFPPQCPKQPPQ